MTSFFGSFVESSEFFLVESQNSPGACIIPFSFGINIESNRFATQETNLNKQM